MRIINLTTDKNIYPLGIDNRNPLFSWQLVGENCFQKKYRIQVASSEKLLIDDKADMWDSGIVDSDNNLHIKYEGKALESCTRYYWNVTVDGNTSDTAWFETAFLDAEKEIQAFWIGQPLGFAGSVDDIRLDFTIDKPVKSSRLYISALGMGRFYLNGQILGDYYFDGSVSVYNKSIYYRTYELNPVMGKNTLCAKVGYGFYGAKKIYGLMRTVFEDGEVSVTPTFPGRAWNVKRDAIRLNGVYDGEVYDANFEEDWMNPDYKVTFGNWVATFAADEPKGKLKANPIPPMKIVNKYAVKTVIKTEDGYLVDIGVNETGFLSITAKGKKGLSYTVYHAERLLPNGKLDNVNLRAAECTDKYIFKDENAVTYTPEFTYHAFQYALIVVDEGVEIIDVKMNHLRSDVKRCSEFVCSNETFNALHEIAFRTESNNLNGVFTDCPQRDERLGWLNDLTSRMYQSVCNFSHENYLANFIDMIGEAQYENGAIQDTVPFEVGSSLGDFVSAYTVLGYLHYKWYGDKSVIERNYPYFKKWVCFIMDDADKNGGVTNFAIYGDWCPALIYAVSKERDTFSKYISPRFMSAVYALWYIKHMQLFARVTGNTEDEKAYVEKYPYYKQKFDDMYLNRETGLYGNGSQGENAVCMTVFDEDTELCKKFASITANSVMEENYHMTCGNQTYRHLIYNLADYGYQDVIEKLLLNKEYPGYGFMLEKGATSVWERWEDSVGSDMHSFNHPMFTAYDGYFFNYVLGINSEKSSDAFKNIVISPYFSNYMDYAKGYIDTLRGRIAVEWQKVEGKIKLTVQTPSNTNLQIKLKDKIMVIDGKEYHDSIDLTNGKFEIEVK